MRGLCDRDDRLAARLAAWLFAKLRVECGCCTFYRVVAFGACVVIVCACIGAAVVWAAVAFLL